jgi:hypothetical protein
MTDYSPQQLRFPYIFLYKNISFPQGKYLIFQRARERLITENLPLPELICQK